MPSNSCSGSTVASITSRRAIGSSSRSSASPRPENDRHGLSYSFTLHAPDGARLVGYDNAHGVPAKGSRFRRRETASDHWHRTENDPGRPYRFKDAETLIDDFFNEVERVLAEYGVGMAVVAIEEKSRSK